jgi:acyl carrier protein
VRRFVDPLAPNHRFRDGEDIWTTGWVNSLEAVQLVLYLEREFGISVPDSERRLDNFRSLDAIATYVEHKVR